MRKKNLSGIFCLQDTLLGVMLLVFVSGIYAMAKDSPRERRAYLLQLSPVECLPETLLPLLNDPDALVRRTAARRLIEHTTAKEAMENALSNADSVIKVMILKGLSGKGFLAKSHLRQLLSDQDPLVRREAVRKLADQDSGDPEISSLLTLASQDIAPSVRELALRIVLKGVQQQSSLREYEDFDIRELLSLQLPQEGWRFQLDPEGKGYPQKWYAEDFADASWPAISIGKVWQSFGYDYVGVAWYRICFDLPDKIACDGVEIDFHGVDESAWVWINGQYAGSHDIGSAGYDVRFNLNITPAIRWGSSNQITVRVQNSAGAGGIWKPVFIHALKVLRPN